MSGKYQVLKGVFIVYEFEEIEGKPDLGIIGCFKNEESAHRMQCLNIMDFLNNHLNQNSFKDLKKNHPYHNIIKYFDSKGKLLIHHCFDLPTLKYIISQINNTFCGYYDSYCIYQLIQ